MLPNPRHAAAPSHCSCSLGGLICRFAVGKLAATGFLASAGGVAPSPAQATCGPDILAEAVRLECQGGGGSTFVEGVVPVNFGERSWLIYSECMSWRIHSECMSWPIHSSMQAGVKGGCSCSAQTPASRMHGTELKVKRGGSKVVAETVAVSLGRPTHTCPCTSNCAVRPYANGPRAWHVPAATLCHACSPLTAANLRHTCSHLTAATLCHA